MTLSARQQAIVQSLLEARRLGQPWQPEAHDESLDLDDAYAVQAGVAQALGWFPDGPRAWKVGGTSLVTAAPLPEVLSSPVNWPAAAQPEWLIEAELAFRLARTPTGPADLLDCLGTVCVSIELIGTRLAGGLQAPAYFLVLTYLVHTFGELCLSPIGLATMTLLAPERMRGQMMGLWFCASALGNLAAGLIGGTIGISLMGWAPTGWAAIC